MASEDEIELTQTQSQSHNTQENYLSQNGEDDKEVWGKLNAKQESFTSVDLTNETFAVGRANGCDYILAAPKIKQKLLLQISKRHFVITRDLSDMSHPTYLQDCSRNGTFVNEERVGQNEKRILANGDVISITHPKLRAFVFKDYRRNSFELPKEIAKKYHLGKKLGAGACGTVFLVHDFRTCRAYALKHIKKNNFIENKCDKTLNEAKIMQSLTHPCVVRMFDLYNTRDSVYFTLELMKGGELLSRIQQKQYLSEDISKFFFYQMCHAIEYLHSRKITHRDLKPDNILLATTDDHTLLKISDFGLSKLVKNNSVLRTLCGTPMYVAPEVLLTEGRGEYTEKVDIWSLGVVLFTCLSGTLPFADEYGTPATEQIKNGRFHFRSSNWKFSSPSAKILIRELLTTDVNKRPAIDELLRHRWLKDAEMKKLAHKIMKIPLDENRPEPVNGVPDADIFVRPYEVDVDSDNIQSSKRRRLR